MFGSKKYGIECGFNRENHLPNICLLIAVCFLLLIEEAEERLITGMKLTKKKKRLRILSASEKREQGGVLFLCTFSKA